MSERLRKHAVTIIVAAVAAVVAAGGIVGAHNDPGDGHVRLAHKTDGFKALALKKVSSSAASDDLDTAVQAADKLPIFSKRSFRIYAKCFTYVDPDPLVLGQVYIKTTQGGAIFSSANEDSSGNAFLTPSTPEHLRLLATTSSAGDPGTVGILDADYMPFYAAVDNFQLNGHILVGTKEGDPTAGGGLFGSGNRRCVFGGTMTWH
jgi:hypothetical protein